MIVPIRFTPLFLGLLLSLGVSPFIQTSLAGDLTVDARSAVNVTIPKPAESPASFKTPDGKEGWVRKISGEALPTPAYAAGRIFTGGGYSSRIFMAIDALNGKLIWTKPTQDNGPTSPVIDRNRVAYNSESCHTEVRDTDTGNLAWSEVTGGTLLTQPVVVGNLLVIPHPIMARKANAADDHFRMLSVDLKTFQHGWDADMTSDVLSAPVTAEGFVYFTCTDGRLFAIKSGTGGEEWHVVAHATSAPVVVGKTLAITTEEKLLNRVTIGIRRYDISDGTLKDEKPLAPTTVSAAKEPAGGRAGWDYQGPKIAAANQRLFNAPGNIINAVSVEEGTLLWRQTVAGLSNQAGTLTPPALGKEKLFIGSSTGHILVFKQSDGSLSCAYKFSEPFTSQPILAGGNIYFGTASGNLVCLKLNDPDAQDWHAWGGNSQHNKVD